MWMSNGTGFFRPAGMARQNWRIRFRKKRACCGQLAALTMAAAIEWNLNHGQRSVKLFEIGRHYRFKGATPVETPGAIHWRDRRSAAARLVRSHAGLFVCGFEGRSGCDWRNERGIGWQDGGPDWLNAAKRGKILLKENDLGRGRIAGEACGGQYINFGRTFFLAEIALGPLYCAYYGAKNARRYEPLPRFPGGGAGFFRCCWRMA